MKTAVEWFFPKIMGIGLSLELGKITNDDYHKEIAKVFEQAKEMEKEQIYRAGAYYFHEHGKLTPNQYYNETFKSETIVTEFKDGTIKVETFKSE